MAKLIDSSTISFSILSPISVRKKHLNGPDSLICTDSGNIIVHNSISKTIAFISPTGELICELNDFIHPWGLAFSDILVFVSDFFTNQIKVYSHMGDYVCTFGKFGISQGQFDNPTGISYNFTLKHLYVADSGNNRIQVFDADFRFVKTFGCQVYCPKDICISSSSQIIVLDESPRCLHIFTFSGDIVAQFAQYGIELLNPWAISISNSHVFVTDNEIPGFVIFTFDGKYVARFGASGNKEGHFSDNSPMGISFQFQNSLLFVSDTGNNRVQVFDFSNF